MTRLKLGPIADAKPVKLTLDLPATLHAISSPMAKSSAARPPGHRSRPHG